MPISIFIFFYSFKNTMTTATTSTKIFLFMHFNLSIFFHFHKIALDILEHLHLFFILESVQFSAVAQSCPTLCDDMKCSMPGLPVHHQLLEFTQLTSIEPVMPYSHLILCRPFSSCHQSLPASESFPMSQLFPRGGSSTGI